MTTENKPDPDRVPGEFAERIESIVPSLYLYATRLVGRDGDADDLVQDTMLELWNRRDQIPTKAAFLLYAVRVLRTKHIDAWRSKRRRANEIASRMRQAADFDDAFQEDFQNISGTVDVDFVPVADAEFQQLQLYLEPGAGSVEDVRAVLSALNQLHVAAGGIGMEFGVDGLYIAARQGAAS